MRRRTLLAGGTPLLLAGCLQLEEELEGETTDDGANPGDDEDADDAGGSNDEDLSFPTGVDEDGVSPSLAEVHRNALSSVGGTVTVRRDELTHDHDAFTARTHVDGNTALAEIDWDGEEHVESYRAPTDGGYWKTTVDGTHSYGRERGANHADIDGVVYTEELGATIHAADWNEPVVDEQAERFEIAAEGVDNDTALADYLNVASIESLTAVGRIDADGIIRELEVEYEHLYEENVLLNTLTVTTEHVGDPQATEPEWLADAIDEAPEINATAIEDRSYIELAHEGGNPIPVGTDIVVHGTEDLGGTPLSAPFEDGDVVYLHHEDDEIHLSRGSAPDEAEPDPLEPNIAVWAFGEWEYFFAEV